MFDDDIVELNETKALTDSNCSEIGEPLVRKRADWSFMAHLQEESASEDSISIINNEEEKLHVLLQVHEGVQAKSPFTVSPKQLVSHFYTI